MQDLQENRSHSKFPRGIGKYSLCERCNNLTGGWYGAAFVDWTKQGMDWLDNAGAHSSIDLPFYIRPLNVIKQILVMAVAMSGERTIPYHYELRSFLLDKHSWRLPEKYRVHTYFTGDGQPKFAAGMAIVKMDGSHGSYVEAEVALPPLGYCVSTRVGTSKSLADYQSLYEITWFANYIYDEWSPVYLKLPRLPLHGPVPLDYRS